MIDSDIAQLLDQEARRINSVDFIADDPVQFPRLYTDPRDIEIAALLCSTIAWGNRKMICRDCSRLMLTLEHQPYRYTIDEGYEDLPPEQNIHRTFFARNLQHYLRGLRRIYAKYGSLQEFARARVDTTGYDFPWLLAQEINGEIAAANCGAGDSRCLPQNTKTTALKRLNMALRWLVRRDGIVDLGIWDMVSPSQLSIPLDVHVGRVARQLGLLQRTQDDRRAVDELTANMRLIDPDDPARFDFALFGLGIEAKQA